MGGEVAFLNLSLFGCCCLFSCLHKYIFSRHSQVIVVTWPVWQAWLAERMPVTFLRRSLESQSSRGILTRWSRKWTRKWFTGTSWTLNLLMVYVYLLGDSYWSMRRPMKTTIQNSSVGTSQPKSSCLYISLKSVFVRMYCEEGRDKFTVRQNVLGHMQQVKHFCGHQIKCKPFMSIATVRSYFHPFLHWWCRFWPFGNSGRFSVAFW